MVAFILGVKLLHAKHIGRSALNMKRDTSGKPGLAVVDPKYIFFAMGWTSTRLEVDTCLATG